MKNILKRIFHIEPTGISGEEVRDLKVTTEELKRIADNLRKTHKQMLRTIEMLEESEQKTPRRRR